MMTPRQIAEKIVETISKKIGRDIKMLKVDNVTVLADYFVICTANSAVQIKSLCDELEAVMEALGEKPLRREGRRQGGWVLMDFGCVVVHVFMEETREFYSLERLWADAEDLDISHLI